MKSVLVSGASTGIGRATAIRLVDEGFRVFAGVRKKADAESLQSLGRSALVPVTLDVTKADQITACLETVGNALDSDGLWGLVNNAGIAVGGPLEALFVDDLRWQFEVNVMGVFALTKAALPKLRMSAGRIVNIGSMAGRVTSPMLGAYAASKHAVVALTAAFRQELAAWGIQVSLVEPGAVVTPIWDKADDAIADAEEKFDPVVLELYRKRIERMAKLVGKQREIGVPPDKVADAVFRALTAKKARTRYPVGKDAQVAMFVGSHFPDRVMDELFKRMR